MQTYLNQVILPLRVLINDFDCEPKYSDDRLRQLLVVAATIVLREAIVFDTTYVVSVPSLTITPDPVDDEVFLNFLVLKAACLADHSTFRAKALMEGVKAVLGPASLSVTGNLSGFQYLLENGPCATYEQMKREYQFGNASFARAILSPFAGSLFNPSVLRNSSEPRDGIFYGG